MILYNNEQTMKAKPQTPFISNDGSMEVLFYFDIYMENVNENTDYIKK